MIHKTLGTRKLVLHEGHVPATAKSTNHNHVMSRSELGAALARMGRGVPKNYSPSERARRRRWAAKIRRIKAEKHKQAA